MSFRSKKSDAKNYALQKRKRRQWLAFLRMCRYGVNNFSRNTWLTIAATAMMTLTLFVIMGAVVSRNILVDSVDQIRNKVDMSIYVNNKTSDEDIAKITHGLKNLKSVKRVDYISPEEARSQYTREYVNDDSIQQALNNVVDVMPGVFRVNIEDINDPSELKKFTENNQTLNANLSPDFPPSFNSSSRDAIENIGKWVKFADKLGIVVSVILIAISSLIVFNTIRMAIFNRKDEIQMMKLIGADKSFIRGPFVVEAIVYGFIAAILSTGLGIMVLFAVRDKLESYGIVVNNTINIITTYGVFVLMAMILVGAIIGIISSLLATRKYLKI